MELPHPQVPLEVSRAVASSFKIQGKDKFVLFISFMHVLATVPLASRGYIFEGLRKGRKIAYNHLRTRKKLHYFGELNRFSGQRGLLSFLFLNCDLKKCIDRTSYAKRISKQDLCNRHSYILYMHIFETSREHP